LNLTCADNAADAPLDGAVGACVVSDRDEFGAIDTEFERMNPPVVIDTH
jgi:hypothetical protein